MTGYLVLKLLIDLTPILIPYFLVVSVVLLIVKVFK